MARRAFNDDNKVYVGGLPQDATKEELEDAFSKFGRLRNVWVARRPPGFAFIHFEDIRDAEDACRSLDGSKICGNRARVEMSTGRRRGGGGGGGGDRGGGGYGYGFRRDDRFDDRRRDDFRDDYRGGGGGGGRGRSRSRSPPPRKYSRSPSRSPVPRRGSRSPSRERNGN